MKLRILLCLFAFFSTFGVWEASVSELSAQSVIQGPKQKPKPKPKPKPRPAKPRPSKPSASRQLPPVIQQLLANMVRVEGGTFTMGATSEQVIGAADREKPTHQVTLSTYYIGKYEVTQAEWEAVMGSNPSYFKGANLPVEQVNWFDCQEFIRKLNELTGKQFRLPTEAEWEYAARGGKRSYGAKYAGGSDIDNVGWYSDNSSTTTTNRSTHPVGQKRANELGLYDMSGNVMEWCQDWYGSYSSSHQTNPTGPATGYVRMLRGGHWCNDAQSCRLSYRDFNNPDRRFSNYGLRLALPNLQ